MKYFEKPSQQTANSASCRLSNVKGLLLLVKAVVINGGQGKYYDKHCNWITIELVTGLLNLIEATITDMHQAKNAIEARMMLSLGGDINRRNRKALTPICTAILKGRSDVVDVLLKNGASGTEHLPSQGGTLVAVATKLKDLDVIMTLMRYNVAAKVIDEESPLHHVHMTDDPEFVKRLIQSGCDVNAFTKSLATPLHHPSIDIIGADIFAVLIRFGALVNRRDFADGNTPLHVPRRREISAILLDHGADINAQNAEGNTPLHVAAHLNAEYVVSILLEHGANANAMNDDSNTPLFAVCNCNSPVFFDLDLKITRKLVEYGARLDARNCRGQTALHIALIQDKTAICMFLLSIGRELSKAVDVDGNRPIHFIHTKRLFEVNNVGYLDLEATNNIGASPLCGLIQHRIQMKTKLADILDTMQLMLNHLPSLAYTPDKLGNTALHYAALYCVVQPLVIAFDKPDLSFEAFRILVDHGADINARNVYGQTPLHLCRSDESINACLKLGAKPDIADNLGRTFVHFLVQARFRHRSKPGVYYPSNILQYLSISSSAIGNQDIWQRTPLHYIQFVNYNDFSLAIVQIASKSENKDFDINARDRFGRTALHYAGFIGSESLFKKLVESGADREIEDADGLTPYQLAVNVQANKSLPSLQVLVPFKTFNLLKYLVDNEDLMGRLYFIHSQSHDIFRLMSQASRLSVCCENCQHIFLYNSMFRERINNPLSHIHKLESNNSCVYHIRPERDATKYISRLWSDLKYSFRQREITTLNIDDKIRSFMERLIVEIGRKDSRFEGKLSHVGSSFEGTRIYDADEYDFNIKLIQFSRLCVPLPSIEIGFFYLKLNPDIEHVDKLMNFGEFFSPDGFLLTTLLNLKFEMILKEVLHDSEFWRKEPHFQLLNMTAEEEYRFTPAKAYTTLELRSLTKLGPQATDYFFPMISVDIVPSINIHEWWPDEALSIIQKFDTAIIKDIMACGCSLVFAPSNTVYQEHEEEGYLNTSARASFSVSESHLIRNCPPVFKAAYMVGKWLVKYDAWRDTFLDHSSDFIFSSHALKTAVLICLTDAGGMHITNRIMVNDYDNLDFIELTKMVQKMLGLLLEFTLQDFIPTFFLPSFRQPVWKFEKSANYSHRLLQRFGIDYKQLTRSNKNGETPEKLNKVKKGFALSHLIYWSVLNEGSDIHVNFPNIL